MPGPSLLQKLQQHPLWVALVAAALVIGLLSSIATLVGVPFWPTGPDVEIPLVYDTSQPLAPFVVDNKSLIFPTKIIRGWCDIEQLDLKSGGGIAGVSFEFDYGDGVIRPADARPMSCRIGAPLGAVERFHIRIRLEWITPFAGMRSYIYESKWLTWFQNRWTTDDQLR